MVTDGKINSNHLEVLEALVDSGYCMHRNWGFGKITTVDTVFARLTVDFAHKAGHSMDLGFAATSLVPIPKSHILARKAADLQSLKQMAALNHLDLIKVVLQSYDNSATLEQIQSILVPDVIEDDWKKWWETAKKEMKKSSHFELPIKKTAPILYHEKSISVQDTLTTSFMEARGLKAKLQVVAEILRNLEEFEDAAAAATQIRTFINTDIESHRKNHQALCIEAALLRDELAAATGLAEDPSETTITQMWLEVNDVESILNEISAARQKRGLMAYQEAYPEVWHTTLLQLMNRVASRLAGDCAHLLIQGGHLDLLKEDLAKLISQHQASSELLLWLVKDRSSAFADILGPEVFRAIMTAIERDMFNEKRSNKLRDYVLDDATLIADLITAADIEVVMDLTRTLKLSTSFDDMDKRSLLARIVKIFPSVQSLISGDQARKQDNKLVVSWESLERRKEEYTELVQKKIPENSKEIAIARSYGDLRENHEYKSAKEMQKILMARKEELENQLGRARGTDFKNPRTDVVSVGTRVHLQNLDKSREELYNILGAWDSDPENRIISYQTPLAQALINQPQGAEVEFEVEGRKGRYRIEKIEAYLPAGPSAEPSPEG